MVQLDRLISKFRYFRLYNPGYLKVATPKFCCPVDLSLGGWISQGFGENPRTYAPMLGHDGIDYAVNTGSLVRAPAKMTILLMLLKTTAYGRQIWARDEYGHIHIFGHLHAFLCKEGDVIEIGQVFALSGGGLEDPYRGFSSGPHLHWEFRPAWATVGNGYGGAEDQTQYITIKDIETVMPPPPEAFAIMKVTNPNGVNLGLYARSNKGRGSVIRTLPAGTEIKVFNIEVKDIALQIDPYKDEWIAGFSNGKKYLTVVKIIGSKENIK